MNGQVHGGTGTPSETLATEETCCCRTDKQAFELVENIWVTKLEYSYNNVQVKLSLQPLG